MYLIYFQGIRLGQVSSLLIHFTIIFQFTIFKSDNFVDQNKDTINFWNALFANLFTLLLNPCIYYNYLMKINYCDSTNINKQEKHKAQTPLTADSAFSPYLSPNMTENLKKFQNLEFWGNNSLTQRIQQIFLGSNACNQISKHQCLRNINKFQDKFHNCDLKITLNFFDNFYNLKKVIKKQTYQITKNEEMLTLHLNKQDQKFMIHPLTSQIVKIELETTDGFHRCIMQTNLSKYLDEREQNIQYPTKFVQLKIKKIEAKANSYQLKSIRLKEDLINEFYDLKFKLLNKNEIINQIKNLQQLQGILYPLTHQNMGSRIIQKLLQKSSPESIQLAVHQLKPYFNDMVTDNYGNHVLQKIFKVCRPEKRRKYLGYFKTDFLQLLKNKSGTFCLQKILKNLDRQELQIIENNLVNDIVSLCTDQFAQHFIIKFLEIAPWTKLWGEILRNSQEIAQDKYGVVVMKKMLKISCKNPHRRYQLLAKSLEIFNEIACTQYGNYFLIQLMNFYSYPELQHLLGHISQYCVYFSDSQYSSSIIKKAIEKYGDCFGLRLINQLINEGLFQMMESSSGTFVLHRLLEQTKNQQYINLLSNQMIQLSYKLNSYQKRTKWINYFGLS